MTAREQIMAAHRPYRIAACICGTLAALGFLLVCAIEWRQSFGVRDPDEVELGITVATRALFAIPYLIWAVVVFSPTLRLRCPNCGKRVGGVPPAWQHCPYCGIDLDADLATEAHDDSSNSHYGRGQPEG